MATEPHQSDIPKWVSNIYREIDGYYVFLPGIHSIVGSFDAHTLRAIADTLDEMNKEWDAVVQKEIRPPTLQATTIDEAFGLLYQMSQQLKPACATIDTEGKHCPEPPTHRVDPYGNDLWLCDRCFARYEAIKLTPKKPGSFNSTP